VTLSGLSASATIHYRVISHDAAGNMAMSSDFSFVTQANPTVPPVDTTAPVISAVTATVTGANSATINWTTNELSDTQVEYGVTVIYGGASPLLQTKVTGHSLGLTGLMPATLYHYRVKSKDAAGNLAVSGDLTFKTSGSVAGGSGETIPGGGSAPQPVIWTQQVKLAQNGATLTKNAG